MPFHYVCPVCEVPFDAPERRRVTCSMECRGVRASRLNKGQVKPTAAIEAASRSRTNACRRRTEERARVQFGVLTEREIALFNFAAKVGYRLGYCAKRWKRAQTSRLENVA